MAIKEKKEKLRENVGGFLFLLNKTEQFWKVSDSLVVKEEKMQRVERRRFSEELSPGYYGICAAGGMLSAGTTHLAVTPLDVLKVNMQVGSF